MGITRRELECYQDHFAKCVGQEEEPQLNACENLIQEVKLDIKRRDWNAAVYFPKASM